MDKYIALLKQQIEKLDQKDFDLEAWKNFTIIILGRIFGENNQKIKQIEKIDYDFSSWALRDTSGDSDYMDSCKKMGRGILEASITELETFGLPEGQENSQDDIYLAILTSIEDELTGSQFKEVKKLATSLDGENNKKKDLGSFFKGLNNDNLARIIAGILSNTAVIKKLDK